MIYCPKELMRKIAIYTLTLAMMFGLATPLVLAEDFTDDIRNNLQPVEQIYGPVDDVDGGTFPRAVVRIINVALGFLGVLFLGLIIYGGYMWMTAAGMEDRVSKAKKIISASIIGVVIIMLSYAITYFVFDQLFLATVGYNAS